PALHRPLLNPFPTRRSSDLKYADLTVLSADYFNVEDADISRIESVLTVVGGKIVWLSAEFEGLAAPLPAPAPARSPVTEFDGFRDRKSTRLNSSHQIISYAV